MSKTPRTDVNEVEITGYAMSPRHYVRSEIARQLETELADAQTEVERLALEIENKQYTITCASEENQQLKESLADARAEIERLKNKENEADALLQKCLDLFEEQVERGEG